MFKKAVVKLAAIYSFLFFVLFLIFSVALYTYVKNSFTQGYITEVHQRFLHDSGPFVNRGIRTEFSIEYNSNLLDKSTQVTLENLRRSLIAVNILLFFLIPPIAWVLAYKSLSPIQDVFKRQKQFVSDVSHELRTPLAIAQNEIEVTLQHERDNAYYIRTLGSLKEEIIRLSDLTKNLLLLAQHEHVRQKISMEDVEVVDVVNKARAALSKKIEEKNIRFVLQLPENNIIVYGNKSFLGQLFYNLIDNAIKFSPEERTITAAVNDKKQNVEISIHDEGAGIAKENLEKIFDRFYRVDESRTVTKGYGLGLAIARMIVELHHGSLSVDSQTNKGSTFTVALTQKHKVS